MNRLGITLGGVSRGGINYTFYPLAMLTEDKKLGVKAVSGEYQYPEYAKMMLTIPEAEVTLDMKGAHYNYLTGEQQATGLGTFPNMFLGYVNNNGEDLERWGGIDPGPNGYGKPTDIVASKYGRVDGQK
jgi:hypothetical protein